jgi:hypothetical protein
MGIALQRLLNLLRQPVHAAPHVGRSRRQPDPNARRNRDHPRNTPSTQRSAAGPTSPPTRTSVPSAGVISIDASPGDGPGSADRVPANQAGSGADKAGTTSTGTNCGSGTKASAPRRASRR